MCFFRHAAPGAVSSLEGASDHRERSGTDSIFKTKLFGRSFFKTALDFHGGHDGIVPKQSPWSDAPPSELTALRGGILKKTHKILCKEVNK